MAFRIAINEFRDLFNINEILELIPPILTLIGISFVWTYFGYKDGIKYFVIINFVSSWIFAYEFFDTINDAIKKDYLRYILNLPIHPLKFLFFQAMGRKAREDYIFALILLPIVIYFLGLRSLLLIPIIVFVTVYTISFYLIYFYISMKLEGSWGLFFFFNPIIEFLGGSFIPIDFLRKIIPFYDYLPFKYFYSVVWDFLNNPLSILPGFFWMGIFSAISFYLYKKALRDYEAYGG